jgi:hypothetical protein
MVARGLGDVHDVAGVALVAIVPGGAVLELKKLLLCISFFLKQYTVFICRANFHLW